MKELINKHLEQHTAQLEQLKQQILMLEGAIQAIRLLSNEVEQAAEHEPESLDREGKEL